MVGVGLMGSAFARNLMKAGFRVRAYDLDPAQMDEHAAAGGEVASSPADASRGMSCVLLSLPDGSVSREVALGRDGIIEAADEGLLLLDTTTSRPEESESLAADLAVGGIRFMDTCVSGTSAMARAGDLVVVAGGSAKDFEAARPVLGGFSRAAYHMGPVGSGARTKLIINLVLAGNRLALAEGLVLATTSGMEERPVLDVLIDAASYSKTMVDKGPKMIAGDFSREGHVDSGLRNAHLMLEQGYRFGTPTFIAGLYAQVMQAAHERGDGEKDIAALIEVFRDLAGLPRRG
jgi:3-hydroxyisobutyrate dehydrogenase-like beta-hydroxyacid dehydrogenase